MHYIDIAIFALGYFISTHTVYVYTLEMCLHRIALRFSLQVLTHNALRTLFRVKSMQ